MAALRLIQRAQARAQVPARGLVPSAAPVTVAAFAMPMTLFEKIIAREIPARIEHEDEHCIVLHDIQPQAPVHLLLVPKKPIPRVGAATTDDQLLLGHLLLTAGLLARKLGLDEGFRLVINHGPHGGESVPHLHIHLLARRRLTWPPG